MSPTHDDRVGKLSRSLTWRFSETVVPLHHYRYDIQIISIISFFSPVSSPNFSPIPQACALVQLKGKANIYAWNLFLQIELEAEDLAEYVVRPKTAIPEPDKSIKPEEHRIWRLARARAMRILYSTIRTDEVIGILESKGWDKESQDPAKKKLDGLRALSVSFISMMPSG